MHTSCRSCVILIKWNDAHNENKFFKVEIREKGEKGIAIDRVIIEILRQSDDPEMA